MSILDHDHTDFIGVDALIEANANQLSQFRTFAQNRDWQAFNALLRLAGVEDTGFKSSQSILDLILKP